VSGTALEEFLLPHDPTCFALEKIINERLLEGLRRNQLYSTVFADSQPSVFHWPADHR
jgi:hypothetical protein